MFLSIFQKISRRVMAITLFLAVLSTLGSPAVAQSVSIVDVLVLYTPQARDGAGGTAAILSNINIAMLEANTVFQNSHANVRLRLLTPVEIEYTESGSVSTDLSKLSNPIDLDLGQASRLRDQYGADLVCLVTETGNDWDYYGLQGPSDSKAFSVIRRPFLTGLYDFPVALSFNFGCQLERAYADSVGAFPYAYGYSFSASNTLYSTVEAYSGQRLPFFSNPDITYLGVAAGVAETNAYPADNALVLNHTAPLVAAFRGSAKTTLPPTVQFTKPSGNTNLPLVLVSGTNLTLAVTAADSDGSISIVNFYAQKATAPAAQFLGSVSNAPYQWVWTNVPPGNWIVSAVAVDNLGATTRADDGVKLSVLPANDNFAARVVLSNTGAVFSTSDENATFQTGEPDLGGFTLQNATHQSLWWTWTAPAAGIVTFSNATEFQILIGVFKGTSLTNLTNVSAGVQVSSPIQVSSGDIFQVAVDGIGGAFGNIQLSSLFAMNFVHDSFTNRLMISGSVISLTNSSAAALYDPNLPGNSGYGYNVSSFRSLWWSWTAPVSGLVTITCPSGQYIDVLTGTSETNLTDITNGGTASFNAVAKKTYIISATGNPGDVILDLVISTIQITSPTNNAALLAGANIPLQISFTTNDTPLGQVEYFADNTSLGVVTSSPYSLVWSNVPVGNHVLTAVGSSPTVLSRPTPPINVTISYPTPSNDNFANRTVIQGSTVNVTNVNHGATAEPGEPDFFAYNYQKSIWYSWTAPASGAVSISISALNSLGAVGVYTGTNISNLVAVAVNFSGVNFQAVAGTTYAIVAASDADFIQLQLILSNLQISSPPTNALLVVGQNVPVVVSATATEQPVAYVEFFEDGNSFGVVSNSPYALTITNISAGPHTLTAQSTDTAGFLRVTPSVNISAAPPNDNFASPIVLSGSFVQTNGSTLGATVQPGEDQSIRHSVWYRWTAPDTAIYSVVRDTYLASIFVYSGSSLGNLVLVASNGSEAYATFLANSNQTYDIAIDDYGGPIDFRLFIVKPAVNDAFANRFSVTNLAVPITGNDLGATAEAGEVLGNDQPYSEFRDETVWWKWTAPASGTLTFSALPNMLSPIRNLYAGSALTNLVFLPGQGPYQVIGGQEYAISASGQWSTNWDISFQMAFNTNASNDNFTNATILTGTNIMVTGDNTYATSETGEPNGNILPGHSVWYSWTVPAAGYMSIVVPDTGAGPTFQIYSGTNLTNLQSVATGEESAIISVPTPGTTYLISIRSYGGPFSLQLSLITPPANDNFASRAVLSNSTTVKMFGSTWDSSMENGESNILSNPVGQDGTLWYSWTAPADGMAYTSFSSQGGVFYGLFTGGALSNLIPTIQITNVSSSFFALKGTEYQIVIATYYGSDGFGTTNFNLSISMPKADIISPTNGTVLPSLASFIIQTRIIDAGGAVTNVAFYDGTNLIAMITDGPPQFPYTFNYRYVPAGDHRLTVQATDVNGMVTTNAPVDVRVQPSNDNFSQRLSLLGSNINFTGDNSGATSEAGEVLPAGATGRTIWWTWTAPTNGSVTLTNSSFSSMPVAADEPTPNSHLAVNDVIITTGPFGPPGPYYGPLLSIYTNQTLTNLSLCASNSGYYPNGSYQINSDGSVTLPPQYYVNPSVTFAVTSGQIYQISLDGANGSFGAANLRLNFTPISTLRPSNDDFANRTILTGASPYTSGTTAYATHEANEAFENTLTNAQTVWYSWTAPSSGDVHLAEVDSFFIFGSSSSLAIGVYTGLQLATLQNVAFGSGFGVDFYVHAGTTYQIGLGSSQGYGTNFYFSIDGPPPPPTPSMQSSGLMPDGSFHLHLNGYTGQSFVLQASTNLIDWDTIEVETFSGNGLDFMDAGGGLFARRFYRAVPLDAFFDSPAYGTFGPANDLFAKSSGLSGSQLKISGDNSLATRETNEPVVDGADGKTVWWTWMTPTNGTVTINTSGSVFGSVFASNAVTGNQFFNGPLISVYSGASLTSLTLAGSNFVRSTTPNYYTTNPGPVLVYSNFTFEAKAGTVYHIALDGCNGSSGSFTYSLNALVHPAFFKGEVGLSNGVYYLGGTGTNFFGYYNYQFFPILYHYDLGFESFTDDGQGGAYFYDFTCQHTWYTSPSSFPYLYDFNLNAWIYYYPDSSRPGHYTTNPRSFYNTVTQKTFTQ